MTLQPLSACCMQGPERQVDCCPEPVDKPGKGLLGF